MEPRKDTPKERQRLLQLFADKPGQLHLPLSNRALIGMLNDGLIVVSHRWDEQMGSGKVYQCVKLSITDAGREALSR